MERREEEHRKEAEPEPTQDAEPLPGAPDPDLTKEVEGTDPVGGGVIAAIPEDA